MICPKCGFEQPDGPECLRCGIVISRYRGPVLEEARSAPPPPPPPAGDFGNETVFLGSAPEVSPPPPPPPPSEGTMYDPSAAPPPSPRSQAPAFRPSVSFESGKLVGETFAIYFSNFIPFVILTLIALTPMFLVQAFLFDSITRSDPASIVLSFVAFLVAAVLCTQIATASITYGVFQQMRGGDTSIGACLKVGISVLLPVLGVAFLQGCAVVVGLLALVIPGIILAIMYSVAVPASVEERPGPIDALRRSAALTQGYRGAIFGAFFLIGLLDVALNRVLKLFFEDEVSRGALWASGAVTVVTAGLYATAAAVIYYRLRSIKESIDVDQIASVFD